MLDSRCSCAATESAPSSSASVAQLGAHDVHASARTGDCTAVDGLAQRPQDNLADPGQLPSHDDDLGVEQVDQTGRGDADVPACVGHDAAAAGVALGGTGEHVAQRQLAVGDRQGVEQAREPTNVSRHPRLPQRQTGPFSSMVR